MKNNSQTTETKTKQIEIVKFTIMYGNQKYTISYGGDIDENHKINLCVNNSIVDKIHCFETLNIANDNQTIYNPNIFTWYRFFKFLEQLDKTQTNLVDVNNKNLQVYKNKIEDYIVLYQKNIHNTFDTDVENLITPYDKTDY